VPPATTILSAPHRCIQEPRGPVGAWREPPGAAAGRRGPRTCGCSERGKTLTWENAIAGAVATITSCWRTRPRWICEGMLIYCRRQDDIDESTVTVRNAGRKLVLRSVDLAGPPEQVARDCGAGRRDRQDSGFHRLTGFAPTRLTSAVLPKAASRSRCTSGTSLKAYLAGRGATSSLLVSVEHSPRLGLLKAGRQGDRSFRAVAGDQERGPHGRASHRRLPVATSSGVFRLRAVRTGAQTPPAADAAHVAAAGWLSRAGRACSRTPKTIKYPTIQSSPIVAGTVSNPATRSAFANT